jgi:hypothetical protein
MSPFRPIRPSKALFTIADGLAAILETLDQPVRPQTVALTFGSMGEPLVCLMIERTPREVDELTHHLVVALEREPAVASLLVATACVGETCADPIEASADEHIAFLEARELFDLEGINLIDWFLVGRRSAVSLAAVTDAQPRWLLAGRPG